jgi:hypothetical protein
MLPPRTDPEISTRNWTGTPGPGGSGSVTPPHAVAAVLRPARVRLLIAPGVGILPWQVAGPSRGQVPQILWMLPNGG